MYLQLHRVFTVHPQDDSATGLIAHFSNSLDCVAPTSKVKLASSSRFARKPEKCTLKPAQLAFPGQSKNYFRSAILTEYRIIRLYRIHALA